MEYYYSAILGLVQALTEFLPISSSAHLMVLPWLFHWPSYGLFFDVLLHWGTALSILIYFRNDWIDILLSPFRLRHSGQREKAAASFRLLEILVVGSIPAAIIGVLAHDAIEEIFRKPWIAAICLTVFGVLLVAADRLSSKERRLASITFRDGILIGLAQTVALIPGVSRSGITITVGRFLGIDRHDSARFSFLLSTPVIFGAAFLETVKFLIKQPADQAILLAPSLLGLFLSTVAGVICIHYFLAIFRRLGLEIFAGYRFLLAMVICYQYFY